MKNTLSLKKLFFPLIVALSLNANISAQAEQPAPKKVNFGYSENPKTKIKPDDAPNKEIAPIEIEKDNAQINTENQTIETEEIAAENQQEIASNVINTENQPTENPEHESRSLASKTLQIARRSSDAAISPTEVYKIGAGDVLFISLQNAPAKASTYYTVLNDGTIDYALAGEMVSVAGLTTEEAEDLLKGKIKLYENPQVSVKVREHASHSIMVLGTVEKAGVKYLQREAMPLFIIKAEAIVQPKANTAFIKRANSKTETVDLKDSKSDDVLIFPGDIVEFKVAEIVETVPPPPAAPQFYFIGGQIISAGQKNFHQGITLTQAILASGGLKKASVYKIVIRRKNQDGLLSSLEFNLNFIKNGKQPDPVLQAGDTIEAVF